MLSCIVGFLSWYYILLSFIRRCREMFISDPNDDEKEVGDVTTHELIRELREIMHYFRESKDNRALLIKAYVRTNERNLNLITFFFERV
ncbi:hypothetical protein LR48_Vigan09g244900 [Vigna angularis]|uniref:Uncharacterized protein n=2 Tax=Phaseolus angularis TaxID=3914 RepID=A0A0L9VFF7_PHAAN|nr:hypothetical protein LR48_Vigan09g244900 [Vigna angularis]BAT87070.1 hypothetical protein VIGAN_05041000 [Vigna angularis var. angularis]